MSVLDFILVALFLLLAFTLWWYITIPQNLPPGPIGLPLFGSTLNTWRASNVIRTLTDWAKIYGPVYKLYVGNQLVLVLGDYDAIHEAFVKQGDTYSGRPPFHVILPEYVVGKGVVNSEGELWNTKRRFALSTLRDFGFGRPIIEPRIKDEADYLAEAIGGYSGKPFDITPLAMNASSNVICSLVFGKRFHSDDGDFQRLLRNLRSRLAESAFSFMTPVVLSESVSNLLRNVPAIKKQRESGADLVHFFKQQFPGAMGDFRVDNEQPTNYVQAFRKAQNERKDDPKFFDEHLIASVGNLFVAGTDTTASTLRFAIFYLCHYPEVQEKVYEELKEKAHGASTVLDYADRTKVPYTEAVIMEVQRMANLLPASFRRTMAPSKLRGFDIPTGTVVVPLLGASLRDLRAYPNPDKFDPSRFLNPKKDGAIYSNWIPFSTGKRNCLGESLAKMELFIFMTAMFSKYRFCFSHEPQPPFEVPETMFRFPPKFRTCAVARSL